MCAGISQATPGIGVLPPCAAEAIRLLQYGQVGNARFAQFDGEQDARHPRANDNKRMDFW